MEGCYIENNVIKTRPPDYVIEEKGLGILYYNKLKEYEYRVAEVDYETGDFITYGELLQRSISCALELRKMGLTKNDIISICSYNQINCTVPYFAAMFLGCISANYDPCLFLEDTIHLMKQVEPKVLFISDDAVELIDKTTAVVNPNIPIVVFGEHPKHLKFEDFLKHSEDDCKSFKPIEARSVFETITINFSSGTTGRPKGISLNHYGVQFVGHLFTQFWFAHGTKVEVAHEDKKGVLYGPSIYYSSLYWISATSFITTSVINGYGRVLCRKKDVREVWFQLDKYKVSSAFFPVVFLLEMLKQKPEDYSVPYLKRLLVGGTTVSEDQIKFIRVTLPTTYVVIACGQTETSGFFSILNINNLIQRQLMLEKPVTCGGPLPGFEYKIVDTETEKTLGPMEKGELRVKTRIQMNGYYNMDSSECWDSEGFLKTGDVMYYDKDFCFFHVDRIKEMLKYKSWHVAPATLEAVICSHPAVSKAVVVGISHPEDGDHPCAFVVKVEDSNITEHDVLMFVNEKVDEIYKIRGGVHFIESIPLTTTGKVRRKELKELAVKINNK